MRRARRRLAAPPVRVAVTEVGDPKTSRALGALAEAVNTLGDVSDRYVDVDLVIGTNRVMHGLQRPPIAVELMPFTADAAFAWGYDPTQPSNAFADRVAEIVVTGATMRARVRFL